MPFGYKDFFPAVVKSGLFPTEYEHLTATVVRANYWVMETKVRLLNVETVVLSNVQQVEDASQANSTSSTMNSWLQVVRVWYEVDAPPAEGD